MDQIAGQISRIRFRLGGTRQMPITIRAPFGGGVHTPELHADSLEGLMAQIPGLRVVIPSNPYDAKGLLISAIRSDDPVVFLEHMKLYRSIKADVPDEEYTIPLDKANVAKEGSDLTIIAYGAMVQEAIKASDELAKQNISAEVVDLRTVSPIDEEAILESVKKTGRAVVVQEAQKQAGVGSQVAAVIAEKGILYLKAPIGRVAAPNTPYPFSEAESDWLPNKNDIVLKAKEILEY